MRIAHFVQTCLLMTTLCIAGSNAVRADENELSYRIERTTILTGPEKYYFTQSRGALVPGDAGYILVTSQEAERVGSHGYHDVFQIESRDHGRTWTEPTRIESLRRQHLPSGDDFAIGDVCPQWHAATGKVLATGKTFTFHDRTREDRSLERVSYSVYSPQTSTWSGLQLLDLPNTDQSGKPINQPNSGCCQRFDLPDGDILLPIRYCREKSLNYTTMVARCRFDGKTLTYLRHGSELSRAKNRGLYEPSLTRFKDRYFLTLRADDTALVARSSDGLTYEDPIEWKFDDGQALGSYNTQQHWVTHRDALFLVYTRRNADNDHIFRHRAPLFIAQFDPERMCVLRSSEQIIVPQNHADLGNFGVLDVSPSETWVIVAEYPATGKRKDERNQVFAAKIHWSRPNRP
jgi:hypothetical protein